MINYKKIISCILINTHSGLVTVLLCCIYSKSIYVCLFLWHLVSGSSKKFFYLYLFLYPNNVSKNPSVDSKIIRLSAIDSPADDSHDLSEASSCHTDQRSAWISLLINSNLSLFLFQVIIIKREVYIEWIFKKRQVFPNFLCFWYWIFLKTAKL